MGELFDTSTRRSRADMYRHKYYDEDLSQNDMALDYLILFGSITPIEALEAFGCLRLSARVADLRKRGYPITTRIAQGKKPYAIYELANMEGEN